MADKTPGVISRFESYTVAEFRRRTGLGDYAFRQCRKQGLRVVEVGKRRFIRGVDWHQFLAARAESTAPDRNENERCLATP